ncbi:hypothetical protein NECAME_14925 [Necator americanus]|uniref:Uncharacterized protein n=1 Tax=Necator americanus TaxID=51031 RepID=W2SKY1_NECAM|nr:hypothetical protein NECAME_14925 [Necator americanus]ETN70213.1 hypothetical protein NECAME_14925 [Necator americanus]
MKTTSWVEKPRATKQSNSGVQAAVAASSGQDATKKRPQQRKPLRQANVVERSERSLLCLSLNNPIRKICIAVVEWR